MSSVVVGRGRCRIPVLYRDLIDEQIIGRHHPDKLANAILEAYQLMLRERLDQFSSKRELL